MVEIIVSIYELLGPSVQPNVNEGDIQKHVDDLIEVRKLSLVFPVNTLCF